MKFLDKLEQKIGRFAIPRLSLILIICYGIGYICYYVQPLNVVLYYAMLDPAQVMNGQIWRLITWIIMPPGSTNIFFYLIMMLFYYQLGSTLEQTWGAFRFNLYIFGGILFTDIGVMLGYIIFANMGSAEVLNIAYAVSTYYINMGIFLAFAMTYPDNRVMLYFIIPIKMKWLAVVYAVLIAISFFQSPLGGKIVIASSLLNFVIFFLMTMAGSGNGFRGTNRGAFDFNIGRNRKGSSDNAAHSGPVFRARRSGTDQDGRRAALHKCAICGKTELTDPNLEFRYCSKCMGSYEYCSEHLFTHTHVR